MLPGEPILFPQGPSTASGCPLSRPNWITPNPPPGPPATDFDPNCAFADGTGAATVSYPITCPPTSFPTGTFSLGVVGTRSSLTPQINVTVKSTGCPPADSAGPTLGLSSTSVTEGDTVTFTATHFTPGD